MMKMIDWQTMTDMIQSADRILITTHENPDGDGLGSAAAMYHHLAEGGRECRIICSSKLPREYAFLNEGQIFEVHDLQRDRDWISGAELALVFDVGDFKRLRGIGDELLRFAIPTLNIDHHPHLNADQFTYNLIDLKAAATGEMLYDYFKTVRSGSLPPEICLGIYTGVMTDTGSFRYSNTNLKCHQIAIECIQAGIQPHKIYQQVYESSSREKVKLLGKILEQLHYDQDGELAWFTINDRMMREAGANQADVDGFTDFVRTIRGVEVALMVFENGRETCRVNFRSKGKYVVNKIAQSLGGGGHKFAAGAVVNGSLEEVTSRVLEAARRSLNSQNGQPG